MGRIEDVESSKNWSITGIYGYPDETNKKKTWDLLRSLIPVDEDMWLCCGDFNDILSNEEKAGGNSRSFTQLSLSRNAVEDCNLLDLGFNGYPFTWSNGRQGSGRIQCRLDRVFASDEFIKRFSPIEINHLARFGSEYAVISIELDVCLEDAHTKKPHVFRFEKCWADDD
jgi:endonuclease/exonuclease/phosphatase family metal-dependent hydrolase